MTKDEEIPVEGEVVLEQHKQGGAAEWVVGVGRTWGVEVGWLVRTWGLRSEGLPRHLVLFLQFRIF